MDIVVMTIGAAALVIIAAVLLAAVLLRRVVATNEVHIVQSSKKTTSYGKDTDNGNTYYAWPSWVPVIGVTNTRLPMSVFDLDLKDYDAYDKGRLPFIVDVKAFFRITDSNVAAQRVASVEELVDQLKAIVQGAVRTVLASSEIEEIMQGRSKFGDEFTKEVNEQLSNWGVAPVKNIELMDIRDSKGSDVIHNIMSKKKSEIEMESRTTVAENNRKARIAEIDATREVDLQDQSAKQSVGLRTVESDQAVALSKQTSDQLVKEQEKLTKEKEMAVLEVSTVRKAEIERKAATVKADQDKEVAVKKAEGALESKKRESEGIIAEGEAKAKAETAMELAPVQAQISLAKEIGANENYQKYLIEIRKIEASQEVGMQQATALQKAEIKIIANTGEPSNGLKNVMDLFSAKGGTELGAAIEAFAQTDTGKAVVSKVIGKV